MISLAYSADVMQAHAPLVRQAAAILAALGDDDTITLRTDAEAESAGFREAGPSIVLTRGPTPLLRRHGKGAVVAGRHFHLTYADPASEATIAALLACAARPGGPIAADAQSISVLALAERLAVSDIPVLIGGPTGTGKEVLSRFIHTRSTRAAKPFIAVNCAAIPEAMLETLLFGHVKGAFTGAIQASEGFFRAADGGTLLLDEIAELPLALQAKLLRTLQEGEVVPIGATRAIPIDVRIIAAANRDLATEVAEGRFRADLYYRLNVFPMVQLPLRSRPDDIAPLAFAMLLRHAEAAELPWISDEALAMLRAHAWPGNVRELENVMRRALLLAQYSSEPDARGRPATSVIGPEHIRFDTPARLVNASGEDEATVPVRLGEASRGRRLAHVVQNSEARAIMGALDQCGGNRLAAARQLGISERTLRYRLAAFREAGLPVTPAYAGARG